MSDASFPVAETKEKNANSLAVTTVSRMWIATVICLLVAIGLTWYSLGESGTEIILHFKQGHGLKPGDALRDRGIDIGTVTSVQLNKDLSGIEVRAELNPAAAGIASEGSRFWIVRPKLDITGISGLETAVGSKYIAVSPGPIVGPIRQHEFVGLESPPVDEFGQGGLELVLRGDERFGINPGSPVTWRGIEVGQVLSSALSPDASQVDTRIRINATHQRLVANSSKFWVISGVQFDAGVTGFEFSAESLATIVRGGIAFITPQVVDDRPVQAGDVFTLYEEEDESWTEQAAGINLLELRPPPMISLVASWQEKLLGFSRSKARHSLAVVLNENGSSRAIVPADFLAEPDGANQDSFQIQIDADEQIQITIPENAVAQGAAVARLPIPGPALSGVTKERLRVAPAPEDCFAVRQTDGGTVVIEAIGKHELTLEDHRWRSTKAGLSPNVWNGAAVLSAEDEKIIGVLDIDDDHVYIAPIN